jgi:hypothetical protein
LAVAYVLQAKENSTATQIIESQKVKSESVELLCDAVRRIPHKLGLSKTSELRLPPYEITADGGIIEVEK